MRILLTGGLGYIGSHLYEVLSKNNDIIIIDNLSNNLKIENNQKLIVGDICDYKLVNKSMTDIDIVIHMAAQINISKSLENPIYDANNNINGTLNILEASRRSGIEKFIYISSAAVYGIPIYLPIDENHPTNPISPYGLSKLTGERYSMLYHNLYGLPVTSLRLFNVFGPGQPKNSYSGVITRFIERIKNNNSPTIFGDGNQIRDFVFINDVIDSICLAIENHIGEIFNIGSGYPIKIKELANHIIDISKKNLNVEFDPPRKGDIVESYSNITKAKNILRYEPKYSLIDGLRLCFNFE